MEMCLVVCSVVYFGGFVELFGDGDEVGEEQYYVEVNGLLDVDCVQCIECGVMVLQLGEGWQVSVL